MGHGDILETRVSRMPLFYIIMGDFLILLYYMLYGTMPVPLQVSTLAGNYAGNLKTYKDTQRDRDMGHS